MPVINFTDQDFESLSENISRVRLSNMYSVQNPLSLSGLSYIPRPTLASFLDLGNALRGIWYQAQGGVTTIYVVAGQSLCRLTPDLTSYEVLGEIPGTDFCTFASTIYGIAVVGDGGLFLYDGVTLLVVEIPDEQTVTDVTSLDNYFIIGSSGTNKFYWILPGESTIDPLSFASAERNPDDIVSVMSVGDELWILGQSTAEVFVDSGDVNAPFVRISGRAYQTGCVDKHSVVRTLKDSLPCLVWVTPSKEVILAQGVPSKISNESIEEVLKRSSTFTAWSFRTNRHDFYVLSTEVATLVYDLTTGLWYRWSTYLKDTWNAVSGIHIEDAVYCITNFDGQVYKLSYDSVDTGVDYLVCEVSGFIPNISTNSIICNNIHLFLNYGFSNSYLVYPVIEVRWSDDGGHTWSDYVQGSVGSQGLYDTYVGFRSLGRINRPGRFIEIRFSEIQSFRFDGATFND